MNRITIELHCHTYHSEDSLMIPERLLTTMDSLGIDKVALTDHNSIAGGLEMQAIAPDRVIIASEIMTSQGELLAYFLTDPVPPSLSPEKTIALLRDQNALISVAHPFDWTRKGSWSREDLQAILPEVDALEIYNARVWSERANELAATLRAETGLLGTVGSDAHTYVEVGRTRMVMEDFTDAEGMRKALESAERITRRSSPIVHLFSRYATWRKAFGWTRPML